MGELENRRDIDRFLDRIIRESRADTEENIAIPDQETIIKYLKGKASERETEQVKRAMAESKVFRGDFMEFARDFEVLKAEDTEETVEKKKGTILNNIFSLAYLRIYVPVAAAAALVVYLLIPGYTIVSPSLDKTIQVADLADDTQRGPGGFASGREAALYAFSTMLEFGNDSIYARPVRTVVKSDSEEIAYKLKVRDKDGRVFIESEYFMPDLAARPDLKPEAWILSLESGQIFRAPISDRRVQLQIPSEVPGSICLAAVYFDAAAKSYKIAACEVYQTNPVPLFPQE